jgi:hypothetical protein
MQEGMKRKCRKHKNLTSFSDLNQMHVGKPDPADGRGILRPKSTLFVELF